VPAVQPGLTVGPDQRVRTVRPDLRVTIRAVRRR